MADTSGRRSKVNRAKKPRPLRPQRGDLQLGPAALGSLFAKRPLVLGEDGDAYDHLLTKITAALTPADIIEALWVKDVTDLTWEAQRLRRLKAEMLRQAGQDALEALLRTIPGSGVIDGVQYNLSNLAACYTAGLDEAVMAVEGHLRQQGLDADTLMARALATRLEELERIERLIAGTEARRNRVLGELERRRDARARQVRRVADDLDLVPANPAG